MFVLRSMLMLMFGSLWWSSLFVYISLSGANQAPQWTNFPSNMLVSEDAMIGKQAILSTSRPILWMCETSMYVVVIV